MPDLPKDYFPAGKNRITEFTIQPGYCGMRGMGTELTPSDLTGDIASNNIVKHWAFDRYGIFPEFPRLELEIDKYSGKLNQPEKCVDDGCAAYGYCENSFEVVVGLKDANNKKCSSPASLAWLPSIQNLQGAQDIVRFCDHRTCSHSTKHNANMDNAQNRICQNMSTLGVVLKNQDFISAVPRRPDLNTEPTFMIVHNALEPTDEAPDGAPAHTNGHYIILVLDQSGSMRIDDRMTRLKSAAAQFVDITDERIHTGLITFNEKVQRRADLTVSVCYFYYFS